MSSQGGKLRRNKVGFPILKRPSIKTSFKGEFINTSTNLIKDIHTLPNDNNDDVV